MLLLQITVYQAFFWPDKQTQILLFQSFLLLGSAHESLSARVLDSGCWPRFGFLLECWNFLIIASFSYNWILSIWAILKIHFLPEISQLQKGLQIRVESWYSGCFSSVNIYLPYFPRLWIHHTDLQLRFKKIYCPKSEQMMKTWLSLMRFMSFWRLFLIPNRAFIVRKK